ncbi:MAG: Tad domain-containing protein [Methylocystaceae bacterium]
MKKQFWNLLKNEKGNVTVLVAVAMVAFCAIAALVIDAGALYLEKGKLIKGTDAAVLAAAQDLPRDRWSAEGKAFSYAYQNGIQPNHITLNISNDNREIQAKSSNSVVFFFAKIFGLLQGQTSAEAAVKIGNVSAVKGVAPLGIVEDDFQYGVTYTLKEGGGTGETGWYGALAINGSGSSVYEQNLMYGSPIAIHEQYTVPTEAGNVSGATRDGIAYRINACNHVPRCSPSGFDPSCPRILIVPIIRPLVYNSGHLQEVLVVGFGAFLVNSYSGNGNDSVIEGSFLQTVVDGETSESAPDYGLYTARLIK